jgi:hypothetical protein
MKRAGQVLQPKEDELQRVELQRVKDEIEALRVAAHGCLEDKEDPLPAPRTQIGQNPRYAPDGPTALPPNIPPDTG